MPPFTIMAATAVRRRALSLAAAATWLATSPTPAGALTTTGR